MKPLLPRADSYLVPIQLPFTQSLFLSSSTQLPLSAPHQKSSSSGGCKRVRIAPKVKSHHHHTFFFIVKCREVT